MSNRMFRIQLNKTGTIFSGSPGDLESYREQFDRYHCIQFPALLEPGLLKFVQRQIDQAEFIPRVHKDIKVELSVRHDLIFNLLHLLSNDRRFFELIQRVTGCSRIGCFSGRVYRMMPNSGHYDSWHNDIEVTEGRIVSMSINLSAEIYSGGVLQIRDTSSQRIVHEVGNVGFGDAIVFRIDRSLQHQVTEVEGAIPKTAFAGWFQSRPDFDSLLKEALSGGKPDN